ncbi:MAG: DUF3276 family protein [Bernardetiaceae bacterium]
MVEGNQDIVYSRRVRAGRRTYFVDVKSTRAEDYYITITESKRHINPDGSYSYKKHKIFLYKEDFNKLQDGLGDAIDYVKTELMPDYDFEQFDKDDSDLDPINDGLHWD